jgi:hypothetical protein
MHKFKARLQIIGINPFVSLPDKILKGIFKTAGKEKGPIPVCGAVNGVTYRQTLVKYAGAWRLYINTSMLKNSPEKVGETIEVTIAYDPAEREIKPHPKLLKALKQHPDAQRAFDDLPPSRQKEILRYIGGLKTEAAIERNITRAIGFLTGKDRFVGRDHL